MHKGLGQHVWASEMCLYSANKYEAASAPGAESVLTSLDDDQTILLWGWTGGGEISSDSKLRSD